MRASRVLAALVAVILPISIVMLQASSHRKAELRHITVHSDRRTHADSEQPTEEVQSIETEVELQDLPTSTEMQTDTEPTEPHTTPKPVNPAVDFTLIRRTSVDKVRLVRGPNCLGLDYILSAGSLIVHAGFPLVKTTASVHCEVLSMHGWIRQLYI